MYPFRWSSLLGLFSLRSLGITPRLALAFASVTVLAAASNFIVENGVSIFQQVTQPDRPRAVEATLPALERESPGREEVLPLVTASQLALAWGNFDKSVNEHAETPSRETAVLLGVARGELRQTALAYAQRKPIAGESQADLLKALQAHELNADAMIRVANTRRVLLAHYATTFASMNARLQASVDGAWKIMGRVVARQSLLKLGAQLDELQNRFAARNDLGRTADGLALVESAEQAFAATLRENSATLRRSQGAEWYAGLNDDFAALTKTRGALAQAERQSERIMRGFSRETGNLLKALAPGLKNNERERVAAAQTKSAPTVATIAPVPIASKVTHTVIPAQSTGRSLVAWVSIIVLALLAYISVVTILSVVRPVRRLVEATHRLARGEVVPRLASGGIRELDTVGHAFNVMADKLAAAEAVNREVLRTLETKVEERTRELQDLAERDPLTGLANRRQLFAALNSSIERAAKMNLRVAAFFLDIDNFKTLNDSLGHAYGDLVLIAIAQRLEETASTFGFAARLGGDEFMIVHEGAVSIEEIMASGTRIVEAFQAPIEVDGRELIVSVSVGASVYPDHDYSAEALLRAADAALFDAKARGRSRLTLFTPDLLVRAAAKFAIEQRLRRAIEKGEFELFYQPEVAAHTFEVCLVEALIRWRMPDGTFKSPEEFLAVAEESGLIMEINDWVLREATRMASMWHHGPWPSARVAVNVSPRQFLDLRFVDKLKGLLEEFKLPARCLELELTESVLQTGPTTIKALEQLHEIGVSIALDDFGTGYSSMASLEQLPLTRIKLDRSLIARIDSNTHSASIARATIGLCNELGLAVTAEGVERLEQFTALLGYQAMSLQGFLIARPVAGGELLPLLKRVPALCHELLLLSRDAALPAVPRHPACLSQARSANLAL
jgi:diguanylate cyclase (GGDEF)-like protein